MAALFNEFKDKIRLVVFNACFSRVPAEAVSRHVECAIGMSGRVSDRTAVTFAGELYRAIGFGKSIDQALRLSRLALKLAGRGCQADPEIVTRKGTVAADLFLVNPSGNTPPPFNRSGKKIDPDQATIGEVLQAIRSRRRFEDTPPGLQHELEEQFSSIAEIRTVLTEAKLVMNEYCRNDKPLSVHMVNLETNPAYAWNTVLIQAPNIGPRAFAAVLLCARARVSVELPRVDETLRRLVDAA
jgi:hypothetical protein